MNPCLFDVLHNTANQHLLTVTDSINIHFNRIVKEAVEQYRCIVGDTDRILEVAAQVGFVIHDFHRTAAQHIRRTHHQRITDFFCPFNRLFDIGYCGVCRLFQTEADDRLLETLTVFRAVNRVRTGADNRHTCCFQAACQLQRRLPAVLNNHTGRFFDTHDFQHIFQCHRFEVEAVRSVIISGNRFRVAVDHDGFIAVFTQRHRRMHTAVVKLNALADTVWSAAEHHNFRFVVVRLCLALFLIRRVEVRGVCRKFRGTGIHAFVNRPQLIAVTQFADFSFRHTDQFCQPRIREAFAFQLTQEFRGQAVDTDIRHLLFQAYQFFNLHQEPAVNVGQVKDAVDRQSGAECIRDIPDPLAARFFQLTADAGQCIRVI